MKRFFCILTTVSIILIASLAIADVGDNYPGWIYDHNAQYASWDYWNNDGSSNGWYEYDLTHNHGLAAPYYEVDNEPNNYHSTYEGRDAVLETDSYGSLVFHFDNYDTPGPEKCVRVIVNYYAATESNWEGLAVESIGVATTDPYSEPYEDVWNYYYSNPGNPLNYSLAGWEEQDDGWIIAAYDFIIEPNPGEEWIQIIFGYDTDSQYTFYENQVFIDEALIHTRCVVPIPGAVWLLGSGLIALVGIRRRG